MNADVPPVISLAQISAEPARVPGTWNFVWRLRNDGAAPLELIAARLPHGQFKADEQRFEPSITLDAGETEQFVSMVRCDEPAGLVTENAFVIIYANWQGAEWRIYVRIRVIMTSKKEPKTATELITTQRAGFSGMTQ